MTYITKPKTVKKSEIENKEYAFSTSNFKFVILNNKKYFLLKDILIENNKWFEPWSSEYVNFWKNYFIRISEMDNLNYNFSIWYDTKKIRSVEDNKKNKILVSWDICYQTASNVWNVCFYTWPKAFYNSHIRKLNFWKDKFYIFWILKSSFWKEQVDVIWSIKWVDNFREDYLLNTKIPFPTKKNNKNPDEVEKLVSLIVQNLIHKEEQIKLKNKQINEEIEKELKQNQKEEKFKYSYPKISEIKSETRLDTWLYEKEFKKIDFLIRNYKYWFSNFEKLWLSITRWQNLQISNIWESMYSNIKKNNKFYSLVLSKNFWERTIENISYLWTKKILKSIKKWDIIFSCRWEMWRSYFFPEEIERTITNIDNVHICWDINIEEKIFIFLYLWFLKKEQVIDNIACTWSWAASFTQYHFNKINIPNFKEEKQKEIWELYYKKVEKNNDLNLENYLEKGKERNEKVWIFQLNMEIFDLREKLENLVKKIVMEEQINIELFIN